MSPSRRGGARRPSADPFEVARRRKRRRERTRSRHRRFARLVLFGTLGTLLVLVASGFTGAAMWMSSCNLSSLKPVQVGANSFVFAADGSLLGSIPAERNRQPVRLGDEVVIEDTEGVVEEIGLIYTFVRTENGDRLVIPNEKLASDTIRNSTIRSREKVAEVTVQVPLSTDLRAVVDRLKQLTDAEVFVGELADGATVVVRARAATEDEAERVERDLRLQAHEGLRAEGVFAE